LFVAALALHADDDAAVSESLGQVADGRNALWAPATVTSQSG
jgi:hypothetical protein